MSEAKDRSLPPGWALAPLGAIAGESVEQFGPMERDAFVYVDIGSVDNDTKQIAQPKQLKIGAVPSRARQNLRSGDVLVSMTRPNLNAVAMVGGSLDGAVCSTGFRVLRASMMESSWLFHAVQTREFVSSMCALVQGALYPAVRPKDIDAWPCPVPPLAEQIRITDMLDELLSDLDAGVAALQRVQEKLKHYRASVLKAAMEGALTADWRAQHPDVEPASALLERILVERRRRWEENQLEKFKAAGKPPPKNWKAKYKEPVAPDTTNLPSLPKEWCWASLDQVALIAGGVTKGQKFSSMDKTREVPYLRVANVQRGYLDLSEIKTIRALERDVGALKLLSGDILFNEGGDRDKLGRGWIWEDQIRECVHQNHVFRARLFLSDVSPKIISWCGNSYGQRWFMRTGRQSVNLASINMTVLRSFPVPISPALEQESIVETAEAQLSVIDHLESDIDAKLKSAQALRQSILREAFSGRLVPQDPNDEPASVLLERIGAERTERTRLAGVARKSGKQVKPAKGSKARTSGRARLDTR